MKTSFLLFLSILIISCSESPKLNETLEQKLVNRSPWTLLTYEANVVGLNENKVSDLEIKNYIKSLEQRFKGETLNFNANGTGKGKIFSGTNKYFTWEVGFKQITFNEETIIKVFISDSELRLRPGEKFIEINNKGVTVNFYVIFN